MEASALLANIRELASQFAADRTARQRRRELLAADFDKLHQAGFLLTAVPSDQGGLWDDIQRSTRLVSEVVRILAQADSSVALVAAMHPAVLANWLASPHVDQHRQSAWEAQRRHIFETARTGAWWGTIISEPRSGGDITRTRSIARISDDTGIYRLTGDKHFGSGSGITSYMITSSLPDGEPEPDLFILDVRGAAWDGSTGMTLIAPWDGHGMIATQSHAFRFDNYPATRIACPGMLKQVLAPLSPFVGCLFTAVIVGIVEVAIHTAQESLQRRKDALRPYEQVEWSRAGMEAWLIQQAFEGMLRTAESGEPPLLSITRGKTAVAELAESVLERLGRVMGGGSYARYSPFGFWRQDVRALGFLRPPWGLAYDTLFNASWSSV